MIGDEGTKGLCEGLKQNTRIEELDMGSLFLNSYCNQGGNMDDKLFDLWTDNSIGKDGGKAIGEMLKTNTMLRRLDLDGEMRKMGCSHESSDTLYHFYTKKGTNWEVKGLKNSLQG